MTLKELRNRVRSRTDPQSEIAKDARQVGRNLAELPD